MWYHMSDTVISFLTKRFDYRSTTVHDSIIRDKKCLLSMQANLIIELMISKVGL